MRTRWASPEPEGPMGRRFDLRIRTLCKSGSIRVGSALIPGIQNPLDVIRDAYGDPAPGNVPDR